MVGLLIEHGADLSATDNDGMTSLHRAARLGRKQSVWLLLQHGSDTSAETNDGSTPEDVAIAAGHTEIAKMIKAEEMRRAVKVIMGELDD